MKTSRRAFLGRAAATGGIALATPWWVGWVGKYFGPSGHIHDTKVRAYPKGWENLTYHTGDGWILSMQDIRREGVGSARYQEMKRKHTNDDSYAANDDGVFVNATRGGQVWDDNIDWQDNFKRAAEEALVYGEGFVRIGTI